MFFKLTSFRLADKPTSHHQAVVEMVKALKILKKFHIIAVGFERADYVCEMVQSLPPNCSITLNEIEWDGDPSIVLRSVPEPYHLSFRSIQITSLRMFDQPIYSRETSIHCGHVRLLLSLPHCPFKVLIGILSNNQSDSNMGSYNVITR